MSWQLHLNTVILRWEGWESWLLVWIIWKINFGVERNTLLLSNMWKRGSLGSSESLLAFSWCLFARLAHLGHLPAVRTRLTATHQLIVLFGVTDSVWLEKWLYHTSTYLGHGVQAHSWPPSHWAFLVDSGILLPDRHPGADDPRLWPCRECDYTDHLDLTCRAYFSCFGWPFKCWACCRPWFFVLLAGSCTA